MYPGSQKKVIILLPSDAGRSWLRCRIFNPRGAPTSTYGITVGSPQGAATMGEVIKRQSGGKFIGWYIRYYDSDGKRRIKASKQATHGEARRMLLQIEAQIARGEAGVAEPK